MYQLSENFHRKIGIHMKLLIAMYMQIQFELILTSNKAPIDNLKKKNYL